MSAPARIYYLIDKLQRAGAQLHLAQLAAGLDRNRFEPHVGCLLAEGPAAALLRERGIPVECFHLRVLYHPSGWLGLARLARRLRRLRIQVLHTYLVSSNVFGAVAGRLARVPAIVTSRRDTGFSRSARLRLVEEWLVNPLADRVTANSRAVADAARAERGLGGERLVTIPNGIDAAAWAPPTGAREQVRAEWGIPESAPLIGSIGHLSPVKCHSDLLEAMVGVAARLPEARCAIVGEGPLRASLEARALELGVSDRVIFAGLRTDVPRVLAALDVLAHPSRTEGLSNALLEGMAAGVPVVATRVGGNPDLIDDGSTGRLVDPGAPAELAEALVGLLGSPDVARRLATAARERVAEGFTLERMIRRHEELYEELLRR